MIGGAAAVGAAEGPQAQLEDAMVHADIDLGQIVRDEFKKQVENAKLFESGIVPSADAQFRLFVVSYGFFSDGIFGPTRPLLALVGVLMKPDGTALWKKKVSVLLDPKTPEGTLEGYLGNPEKIKEGFKAAASVAVSLLVADMRGVQ